MNPTSTLRAGAILGGLAVAAGAFGAHLLEGSLSAEDLEVFEIAVRYQMYHALALLLCAASDRGALAARCFLWGTVVFSGSLYALIATGAGWLGAITPVGGTLLLVGWIALAWGARPGRAAAGMTGNPPGDG